MMKFTMTFYCAANLIAGKILLGLVMVSTIVACATAEQKHASRAQEKAYQVAITRGINAHVYEMSCQAVLPVAEEVLIKRGYSTLVYDQDGLTVEMLWKDDGEATRSRYIAQGMALGHQRCNLQVVLEKDVAGQRSTQRSDEVEMELINRITPDVAKNITAEARTQSEAIYRQTLQQQEAQKLRNNPEVKEVNDQQNPDLHPEQL